MGQGAAGWWRRTVTWQPFIGRLHCLLPFSPVDQARRTAGPHAPDLPCIEIFRRCRCRWKAPAPIRWRHYCFGVLAIAISRQGCATKIATNGGATGGSFFHLLALLVKLGFNSGHGHSDSEHSSAPSVAGRLNHRLVLSHPPGPSGPGSLL